MCAPTNSRVTLPVICTVHTHTHTHTQTHRHTQTHTHTHTHTCVCQQLSAVVHHTTTVEIQKAELEPKKIAENTATPSNAHPLDEHVSTSAESDEQGESVDLLKCEEVNYETRNRAPGVRFRMPDGEEGWTPVVRKRPRSRRQVRMLRKDENSGSDSDSDLRRAITAKKIT